MENLHIDVRVSKVKVNLKTITIILTRQTEQGLSFLHSQEFEDTLL